MPSVYCFTCWLCIYLAFGIHNNALADSDLGKIFGNSVDKEDAWSKLFELEGCPKPEVWDGTIINVNKSLAAGARFMENPNVTSRYECEFDCCYKQQKGCNIAVYTADQKHCYLFDCGRPSKCKFDQHSGYTVSSIAEQLSNKPGAADAAPKTTTTTVASSTTQSPPKELHLLDGCRPGTDTCITENTKCSDTGFCMCLQGYHPKNGVCRQNCLEGLQFECTNGDAKYGHPDCIAVYDMCDGTPQCPDGSDEKDCNKAAEDNEWLKVEDIGTLRAALKEYMNAHTKSSTHKVTATPTTTAVQSVPDTEDIKAILSGTTRRTDSHEKELAGLTSVSAEGKPTSHSANETTAYMIEAANNQSEPVINKEVKTEREANVGSGSKSAVIALSLTVTLSLVLLAYLGCRYRSMRRRVTRHGKAMNGSEVDYLIDGMYL